MQFPSKMLPLEKWCAFKGQLPPGSESRHYIVIVYRYVSNIKYFYVTSKVEKARRLLRDDNDALVELNPSDWDILTKHSCIQCDYDHLEESCEDELKRAYADGTLDYLGKIPENIKAKIISAICASISFTNGEKAMYAV